jgi:hypothetical protein
MDISSETGMHLPDGDRKGRDGKSIFDGQGGELVLTISDAGANLGHPPITIRSERLTLQLD